LQKYIFFRSIFLFEDFFLFFSTIKKRFGYQQVMNNTFGKLYKIRGFLYPVNVKRWQFFA